PVCSFRLLDMGIALGSAVKTASMLNVDNRIMYRVGAVARDMKLVDWEFVMGIPLSVTGKSIYFDR
ncbi:MAG: ferredoxin domain-containing protein, partial [Proteobacteria bacterium]|nr:ferredoxin domain-containing protein [Pseudomonadota bacterium]